MSGGVLWITGLPGVGKTVLADAVAARLTQGGARIERLDGDAFRAALGVAGSAYDRDSRLALAQRYVAHAHERACSGVLLVASVVALFSAVHEQLRQLPVPYLEVWLRAPESLRRSRAGDHAVPATPRIGVDIEAQFPQFAHLVLDNDDDPATLEHLATRIETAWRASHAV